MTNTIVGIRFQRIGKIYHFRADHVEDIRIGDFAVVETSRGRQLGEVVEIPGEETVKLKGTVKPISRLATPRDLVLRQVWQYKEKEAVEISSSKLKELKIKGVKIVAAEYTFDGKRLTIMYNSEGDEAVDLSRLLQELRGYFRRTRIDLRQIGPRDVAKTVGGMGVCGMAARCCAMYLTDFQPISIRMAKNQGVSLAPTEITGMCGRLRCCLDYENEAYAEARKTLPREKQHIDTPEGGARVLSVSPLVRTILVMLDGGGVKEFSMNELEGEPAPVEEEEEYFLDEGEEEVRLPEPAPRPQQSQRRSKRKPPRQKRRRN